MTQDAETTDTGRRRATLAALVGVVLIGGLALAACGGSGSPSTKSGKSASNSASFSAYEACLSKHGATLRTGGFSGHRFGASGASGFHRFGASGAGGFHRGGFFGGNSKFATALRACSSLRPAVAGGYGGPPGGGAPASTQ
jgi:hypothetical protein